MKKLSFLIIFLIITGCSKNSSSSESNVEIEYISGWTILYNYAYGTIVGGNCYIKFEVADGSGDITFTGYVNGSKEMAETFTIEEGLVYKLRVAISFGNCAAHASSTAEIRSPSAQNNASIKVDCSSLTIKSITISEVTD